MPQTQFQDDGTYKAAADAERDRMNGHQPGSADHDDYRNG